MLKPLEDGFQFQIKLGRDVLNWPIELLRPSQLRVRVSVEFIGELEEHLRSTVSALPLIDKFARCFVNGQTFSSENNSTDRGSVVKSMFALKESNDIHSYFGVVRFYFKVYFTLQCNINGINQTGMEDKVFAYVTWLTFRSPSKDKTSGLFMVNNTFYERDRILSPRRFVNRCILAPVAWKTSSFYVCELPL